MTTRPGNPKSLSTKRFSSERSARGLSVWKYFLQAAIQPLAMSLCAMEENRIKEFHDGMQIGRTSCSNFLANTFRVLLTAAAYVLIQEMRLRLTRTPHAHAQVSTLREHFLKLG